MSNISGEYAIVGVAETKVGKRPDASTHSLHLECIKACLDDAGIKASDVELRVAVSAKGEVIGGRHVGQDWLVERRSGK